SGSSIAIFPSEQPKRVQHAPSVSEAFFCSSAVQGGGSSPSSVSFLARPSASFPVATKHLPLFRTVSNDDFSPGPTKSGSLMTLQSMNASADPPLPERPTGIFQPFVQSMELVDSSFFKRACSCWQCA